MLDLILRIVINTLAFVVAVKIVPGISAPEDVAKLLAIGLILGLVNTYIRPIVKLLAFPITILTLGLIGLVINGAMLLLTALVSDQLDLGFQIAGWPGGTFDANVLVAAILAALVISIVSTVLAFFLGQKRILGLRV